VRPAAIFHPSITIQILMPVQTILALLNDSAGNLLLVRRKESLLWSLPGGVLRTPTRMRAEFLAVCCRRQVGVTPDFVAALREFEFAGQGVAVGSDEICQHRARACGRVESSRWFRSSELPVDLAPLARMAIGLFQRRPAVTVLPVLPVLAGIAC
jgi:ADP-ribose pyrophosphatase YjhB (NUDIX family)